MARFKSRRQAGPETPFLISSFDKGFFGLGFDFTTFLDSAGAAEEPSEVGAAPDSAGVTFFFFLGTIFFLTVVASGFTISELLVAGEAVRATVAAGGTVVSEDIVILNL